MKKLIKCPLAGDKCKCSQHSGKHIMCQGASIMCDCKSKVFSSQNKQECVNHCWKLRCNEISHCPHCIYEATRSCGCKNHESPQVAGDWSEEKIEELRWLLDHYGDCKDDGEYRCTCGRSKREIDSIKSLLLQQQQRTIEEIEKINGTVTPGDKKYWNERFGGETANFIENAYISGVETVKLILRSKLSLKQGKEGNE